MKKIDIPEGAITKHLNAYYDAIKYALDKLSKGVSIRIGRTGYEATTDGLKNYYGVLHDNFADRNNCILVASPTELQLFLKKERDYWNKITKEDERASCIKTLKALFSYEHFSKKEELQINSTRNIIGKRSSRWGAGAFIEALNVKYCPYCNAETVYSIKLKSGSKTIRSALDHYYSQANYPCLSLSLYNLVPACTRCNSQIKRDREFNPPANYANPFEDDIHAHTRFSYLLSGETENLLESERSLELMLRDTDAKSGRVNNLMEFFRVEEVYNALFKSEALNALETKRRLMSGYEKLLRTSMPELSDEQFYRLVYGCSLNPDKINQERLSKMTIDLVKRAP